MKSLIYLPLLLALCICIAQADGVTYKAFKLRTDYGNFVVLAASNSTKCDDLSLVFNTNGDIKKAAKTQGSTVLQSSDVENALVTSLSLKDFQARTTLNIQNVAESTTNCVKARRHRLHSKKNKAKILDTDSVYITTFVNKHLTLKDKLYNSDDEGNNQYFDTASAVKEYWWHAKDKGTGKPSSVSVAKDLGLKNGKAAIKAVKLYYRLSGAISKSVILEGNKRFHGDNLFKQVPTVSEAAYWFVWKPSGVADPADIHHEFLEVCLEDGSRLIVDRGSRETALQDTFNTRVRFILLDSNGGDCSLDGNNWVDKELADKKFTDKVIFLFYFFSPLSSFFSITN